MIKKRTIVIITILPFLIGFFFARNHQTNSSQHTKFLTSLIPPTDTITISSNGDVYRITTNTVTQVTHNKQLSEPTVLNNTIVAVSKTTNNTSLLLFNTSGTVIKTLFSGNNGTIDKMNWATDPAVSPKQDSIAYVSDQNRQKVNIPDNALFLLTLADGKSTMIAEPDPYSGGITHPAWNPKKPTMLTYDYYQYDPQSLTPYSTIKAYDIQTQVTTTLTTEKQNAYQEAFSPDGKQLLFLGRNVDTNSATIYLATVTDNGLTDIHQLITGNIAYPLFSNTTNIIYYLQADGNTGYNLIRGTIKNMKLITNIPLSIGSQLLGNSSYSVTNTIH